MPTFVTESVEVLTGDAAALKLAERRDDVALSCSEVRWQEAQRYERKTWMELHRGMNDDRNREHAGAFGHYLSLRRCGATSLVEVGCGPFTNARLILPVATKVTKVTLSDPLIEEYATHPHCQYPANARRLPLTVKQTRDLGERFDLVVCVNVAEHCDEFDLQWLDDMCAPGGHVVCGERVYSTEGAKRHAETVYDAGHPLRLTTLEWAPWYRSRDFVVVESAHRPGGDGGLSTLRYVIRRKR